MATVEKRLKKIWNGITWIEVYHPTSDDLVFVGDGSKTLRTKLGEIDSALQGHNNNADIHMTPQDKGKLENLAQDANGVYATKNELGAHEGDNTLHWSATDRAKFANVAADADATYATKAEVAGEKKVYYFTNLAARDASTITFEVGDTCWVSDATGDANLSGGGSAVGVYMYVTGGTWQFVFEASSNLVVNWGDILGVPSDLEDTLAQTHEHVNGSILADLSMDNDNNLLFKGVRVGGGPGAAGSNRIYLTTTEPTDPLPGDMWLPAV